MSRTVTIAAGKNGVSLPNGKTYDAGAVVVLSDEQYSKINPSLIPSVVIDNGASSAVSGSALLVTTTAGNNVSVQRNQGANLHEVSISNYTANPVYVKFYNKASAPTLASDVPIMTIVVAAGAFLTQQFGSLGKRFSAGIALAVTGAAAANDTTNTLAGAVISGTYA